MHSSTCTVCACVSVHARAHACLRARGEVLPASRQAVGSVRGRQCACICVPRGPPVGSHAFVMHSSILTCLCVRQCACTCVRACLYEVKFLIYRSWGVL